MKLYEYQGKELLKKYGVICPQGTLHFSYPKKINFSTPVVIKSQILSGGRGKAGGILVASGINEFKSGVASLLGKEIKGEKVEKLLLEEHVKGKEYYVSFSYSTDFRGPVMALSTNGGVNLAKANIYPVDMTQGLPSFFIRYALKKSGFPKEDFMEMAGLLEKLWNLFLKENALLVEINPLFRTAEGKLIAGDAKIVLDDEKINPGARRFISLNGDIAILASGGGASMVNIDDLLHFGGKPANYTEYSGNPPAKVVKELTKKVLAQKNLKGCWVVGGTANFTDIFETMRGFVDGLREIKPKPLFPIVVRRDGPRQKEAFAMLRKVAKNEGYQFHLYGRETPMSESSRIMVELAYKNADLNVQEI